MSDLEKIRPSYKDSFSDRKDQKRSFILSTGIRSVFYFCLFISGIIFIDGFLPETESKEKIKDWYIFVEHLKVEEYDHEFEAASTLDYRIRTDKNEFSIHKDDALSIYQGDSIIVKKTPLFKTLTGYYSLRLNKELKPYIDMYGMFIIIPVFMMVFSIIGLLKKTREDVFITFGVLNIILLCSYFFIRLFYT